MTRHVRNVPVDISGTGIGTASSLGTGLVFSLSSILVVASGRFYHAQATRYVSMSASLAVAGSTTTTVNLRKNNVTIANTTISFLATELGNKSVAIDVSFDVGDYMTAFCSVAGTGARNLVIQVR